MSKNKSNLPTVKKELSPAHVAAITNTERAGTALLQAGQQLVLAVEEVLKTEFQFTQDQLQHFEKQLTKMMETLSYIEEQGMTVQTIDTMRQVSAISAHIADIRKKRFDIMESGLLTPSKGDIKKING